jgi:potassium efflux system protein
MFQRKSFPYFRPAFLAIVVIFSSHMIRSAYFIRPAVLLGFFLLITFSVTFAQQSRKWRRSPATSLSIFNDSVTASAAEYMLHLEVLYQKMDSIQHESTLSPEVLMTAQKLKENDTILHFVNRSLLKYDQTLNLRNLEMLRILVEDVQRHLRRCAEKFKSSDLELTKLKLELGALRRDTLLRQLIRDSVVRKKFQPQLRDLRAKRRVTDSLLRNSLTTLNTLKTQTSAGSIMAGRLMSRLNTDLSSAGKRIFAKELNYLWEPATRVPGTGEDLKEVFKEEQQALNLYLSSAALNSLARWLIGLAFLLWVARNLRILKRADKTDTLKSYNITFLALQPIASAFVVVFSIAPLFDLHAPAAYVQVVQFLLLIALTFLYRRQWPRRLFYYWLGIVVMFLLFSATNHILVPAFWQRCAIIILNGSAVVLALLFLRALPRDLQLQRFMRVVLVLQIAMHIVAIICILYGRSTLSQMLGATSVFAITQVIGLSALVRILVEALLLQIHTSRIQNSLLNHFDPAPVIHNFRKPLLGLVLLMWLVVFATNLNIYDTVFTGVADFLDTPRNIGNTPFTVGNVVLFFLIIWLAHFIQRYVGYLLGDVGDDEGEGLAHRSKLLMTRLVLLAGGYLLAVAASGLPVDKITIVLGALGVGIGLGLQNIVSNFVSGIILIFDRPLKIGDSVEIGSHAGRVKEIGLRSSTLATEDGADIIIPNGDLLSQHIVNWTLGNTYKRIELTMTVDTTWDKDTITALVKEVIKSTEHVLHKREPVVLVENTKGSEFILRIFFWCEDVYKADVTQSEVRYQLYQEFRVKKG